MVKIDRFIPIGQVLVPVSEDNRYLDWRGDSQEEAEPLCGPAGPLHYFVGDDLIWATLDFFEMPDGRICITADYNSDLLHPEDGNVLLERGDATAHAFRLCDRICDGLKRLGTEHREELYGADAWHFMRSVAAFVGLPAFRDLSDEGLRWPKS